MWSWSFHQHRSLEQAHLDHCTPPGEIIIYAHVGRVYKAVSITMVSARLKTSSESSSAKTVLLSQWSPSSCLT